MAWKNMSTIAPQFTVDDIRLLPVSEPIAPQAKIAVAGAGAFGGWAALSLLRLGYKVSLFDPWGAGNSLSSSGGETRLMRCVYGGNAFYTRLAMESYRLWQQAETESGRRLLAPTGTLWFAGKDDGDVKAAMPIMNELGLPYQVVQPAELAARFPWVNADDLQYILIEERAGVLKARESCQAVLEIFVNEGGEYIRASLQPGKMEGGKMSFAEVSDGTRFSADLYLFAAGPWLKTLFPGLLDRHLSVTRQEVFYFGLPGSLAGQLEAGVPAWIDMSDDGGFYGIPGGVGRGFKIASDRRGPEMNPTLENRLATESEIERAREFIRRRFPSLGTLPLSESRVCQYTNTPDGSFLLDKHPEASNVWMLGGGSGHGFKHGPALGGLAAAVVSGKQALPYLLSLSRLKKAT